MDELSKNYRYIVKAPFYNESKIINLSKLLKIMYTVKNAKKV